LPAGQFKKEAGKYMLKVSKVNLRWEDIQMAEIALDKLVLHFSQCNKAEGKSPKTVAWHTQMLTSFLAFLKTVGLDKMLADLTPSNVRGFILYEQSRKVSPYTVQARAQDREDLLHTIMVTLADVSRNNGHKPFTEVAMYRVASVTVTHYWRAQYRLTNGLECGSCSKAQRQKCRSEDLYSECPKAIKLEYLSQPITDDGNLTELGELIADDKAIDLDAWLDSKTFLTGCPQKLIGIAHKRQEGIPLDNADMIYLCRYRQREQKRLVE
jgi:hypothetical protein